jgi:hypothetical protein
MQGHRSHSQAGESGTGMISRLKICKDIATPTYCRPRMGIISKLKTHYYDMAATNFLKSQGHALSAGLKHSKAQQPLTSWPIKYTIY